MMGRSHAISGFMGGTIVLALSPHAVPLAVVPTNLLLVTGYALAPDADHPMATVAQSFKPFSQWICSWVGRIAHGHRGLTHTLFGVGMYALCNFLLIDPQGSFMSRAPNPAEASRIIGALLGGIFVALGLFALDTQGRFKGIRSYLSIIGFVGLFYIFPVDPYHLIALSVFGCLIHLAGDLITTEGLRLLYPFTNIVIKIPLLGNAGSKRELFLCKVMLAVSGLCLTIYGARMLGVDLAALIGRK